jgi:hypothetical protein
VSGTAQRLSVSFTFRSTTPSSSSPWQSSRSRDANSVRLHH